jgi:hypothetical protein
MKKILLYTLFFINISYFCFGQTDKKDRLESIQIAFLTKELSLTPEEAQKFWPVYNDYKAELAQARKASREDEVEFEEKVLTVRKKYKGEFKKVLDSDERANEVFVAEKNFREMLRKELQKRQDN